MRDRRAPRRRSRCAPRPIGLGWSSDLLVVLLDDLLVGRQRLVPEPVELSTERAHAIGIDPVDAAVARGPVHDESRVLEHLQVLRDRGSADWELARELADRLRAIRETLEEIGRASGR